jgi:hypothetical protein
MNFQEKSNLVKNQYPIGLKVKWSGEFSFGFQSGIGIIINHIDDEMLNLVTVQILTKKGVKDYIVAQFDNKDFKVKGLHLLKVSSKLNTLLKIHNNIMKRYLKSGDE